MAIKRFFLTALLLLVSCGGPVREKQSPAREEQFVVEFKKLGLSAAVVVSPFPPAVDEYFSFTLRFWKTAEGTVNEGPFIVPEYLIAHPGIRLYMPEHGHGSAPFMFAEKSNSFGKYFAVSNGVSTMPGNWEIQLRLKKDKTAPPEDEAVIKYFASETR